MWVTNSKLTIGLEWLKKYGFKHIETISWVKLTEKETLVKGHGKHLLRIVMKCVLWLELMSLIRIDFEMR